MQLQIQVISSVELAEMIELAESVKWADTPAGRIYSLKTQGRRFVIVGSLTSDSYSCFEPEHI